MKRSVITNMVLVTICISFFLIVTSGVSWAGNKKKINLHVIAFDLANSPEVKQKLESIASAAVGSYHTAEELADLSFTMQEVVTGGGANLGVGYFCNNWGDCEGTESGHPPMCQDKIRKGRTVAIKVNRDNACWRKLPSRLTGIIEISAWVLPSAAAPGNFSIRLGDSKMTRDGIVIGVTEAKKWFANLKEHTVAPYKGDWTKLRLYIDTNNNYFSLWLDEKLILQDEPVRFSVNGGIDVIGLQSGRGAKPVESYIEGLLIKEAAPSTAY